MLDLRIINGHVVDGTGAPRVRADVGIADRRVVAIGSVDDAAKRTIDAHGLLVTPGFVDVHTHLDAQLFWDPTASPSPLHGVTTAFAGNCGFTIAPLTHESAAYLMPMLARVEGMPLDALRDGVPWNWTSTADYLAKLRGRVALNVGFMVGHSAIRRAVMGAAANERIATPAEVDAMAQLLRAGIEAGAMGFSTTTSTTHNDALGAPVPSRFADFDEMVALARVVGEYPGTSLELLPKGANLLEDFDGDTAELMIAMTVAAQRPLNWNVISTNANQLDGWKRKLEISDRAAARGGKIVGLTMPVDMKARFSFHAGFVLDGFNGWNDIMAAPLAEKIACLRDPAQRQALRDGAESTPTMRHLAKWSDLVLIETFTEATARFKGRLVGEIAAEQGQDPWEVLCEIAISDELRTTFARRTPDPSPADWAARVELCRDKRAMIGASDAGAHLDMIAAFRYSTGFLQEAVRERNLLPLEEAVMMLTSQPAALYGLHDRGVLREGAYADVLVFEEGAIGSTPVETRFDLPGGAGRLYADATGIDHVLINGVEVASHGAYTGRLPGEILRSGIDTHTPSMAL